MAPCSAIRLGHLGMLTRRCHNRAENGTVRLIPFTANPASREILPHLLGRFPGGTEGSEFAASPP